MWSVLAPTHDTPALCPQYWDLSEVSQGLRVLITIYHFILFPHKGRNSEEGGRRTPVIFISPSQEPGASRDRANPGPEPRAEPEPVGHETLTRPPSRNCDSLQPGEYSRVSSLRAGA